MKKIIFMIACLVSFTTLIGQNSFQSDVIRTNRSQVTLQDLIRQRDIGFTPQMKENLTRHEVRLLESAESGNRSTAVVTITQSNSQTIEAGAGVACATHPIAFRDNNFYRDFDLPGQFGITNGFEVQAVEFALEDVSTPNGFPITINIYSATPGSFPSGSKTLEGTAVHMASNSDAMSIVNLPLSATIPAGKSMIMELEIIDDGTETNYMVTGVNSAGETGPSYIMAPVCGANSPTPFGSLGLSVGLVWNVIGDDAPSSGGPFPDPYCEVSGNSSVEAISRVVFADIDNPSDPNGNVSHEDFTSVVGHVNPGETYSFAGEGNTAGPYTNYFTVWIDWNQDGVFDETTERYDIGTIYNSNGVDGQQAVNDIEVPSDALEGATRMRVMKRFSSYPTDSCTSGSTFGQTEDYTIEVSFGSPADECDWTVIVQDTGFGDEVEWELRDQDSGSVLLSGGGYGLGYYDEQTVTAEGPLEFYITNDGFYGDNEAEYSVSNGSEVLVSGTMPIGGDTLVFSDLECGESPSGGGETCEAPLWVTSLPYDHGGNTGDYGNNYSNGDVPPLAAGAVTNGTGSEYYLSGAEVVYAYTPDEDEVLNVSTTNDDDWVGLWAFTGCPFNSTVGYHTSTSGGTRLISELPVTAGETYYFVISSWAPPETIDYTIHIEKVGGGGEPGGPCEQGYATADPLGTPTGVGFSGGNIVANDILVQANDTFTVQTITFDVILLDGNPVGFDLEIFEDNGTGGVGASTGITQHFDSSNMTSTMTGYWANLYPLHKVVLEVPNIELTAGSDDARYWLAIASEYSSAGGFTYWSSDDYVSNPDSYPTWQYLDSTQQWQEYVGPSEGVMWVEGLCDSGTVEPGDECDITTLYSGGNNGSPGGAVYFDVTVGGVDIDLTALDVNTDNTGGTITLDVYTIEGTYAGNETNQSAWTLRSQASGTGAGQGNPSHVELDDSFTLSANTTYGMALVFTSSDSHYYTNGTGANQHYENGNVALDLGSASNTPFDSPFTPRVFNGGLYYEVEGGCGGGVDPVGCPIEYSGDFEDGLGNLAAGIILAADFPVPAGETWDVGVAKFELLYDVTSVNISFYEDGGAQPGAQIAGPTSLTPVSQAVIGQTSIGTDIYEVELDLSGLGVSLEGGSSGTNYWVAIETTNSSGVSYWHYAETANNGTYFFYSTDYASWTDASTAGFPVDGAFSICIGEGGGSGDDCGQGDDSNNFENGFNVTAGGSFRNADDFFVSPDNTLNIQSIEMNLFLDAPASSINLNFYEDIGGAPGSTIVESVSGLVPYAQVPVGGNFGYIVYAVFVEVDLNFAGGSSGTSYWMQPEVVAGTAFWEVTSAGTLGEPIHTSEGGGAWIPDEDGSHAVFKLYCDVVTPPDPECLFDISFSVEPITRVVLSDIDNPSSATVNGSPALEDFTHVVGNMAQNTSYDVALEGNTDGPWTNYFTVWVDWNQDGEWDSSEMYEIGSIYNSTGEDGQQATGTISVPADATLGETTMRVIKNFNTSPTDPCGIYDFGQAEDYTINVTEFIGIEDQNQVAFTYYPNPTTGLVTIVANRDISSVSVMNVLGQEVMATRRLESGQVDLSSLATGTYIFRVAFEDGTTETFKIIRE